jgi:hypothetical protein
MNCDCDFCKFDFPVSLPEHLIESLLAGELVIFAGAGISTESSRVLKYTFYDEIEGSVPGAGTSLSFPELMQRFVDLPDGRLKLLQLIRRRFEHIDSFPELNMSASRFHRELGTLFLVNEIVTTNWDTYFETHCHATSFVTDPDVALWNAVRRKVLKIHGSIQNLGSIVATTSDYVACLTRLNTELIGSQLKNILATRTVVFIGYSLRDSDFLQLYGFVKQQLDSLHRKAYVVTPFAEEATRLEQDGLIAIRTDGTFFIRQLKTHLVAMGVMIRDDVFDAAGRLLTLVRAEHARLHERAKMDRLPEVIYAASYQDGLMHALDRALQMQGSGEYSHPCYVGGKVRAYESLKKEKRSARRYEDVAYIEGYTNGMVFLAVANTEGPPVRPPLYFAFGQKSDLYSLTSFLRLFSKGFVPHAAARKRAQRLISKFEDPRSVEFHHPPWL